MSGDVMFTADGVFDDSGPLTPAAGAAFLVRWIEDQGGVFTLDKHDVWRLDLNPMPDMDREHAETISKAVFSLRDEIRAILIPRRTCH